MNEKNRKSDNNKLPSDEYVVIARYKKTGKGNKAPLKKDIYTEYKHIGPGPKDYEKTIVAPGHYRLTESAEYAKGDSSAEYAKGDSEKPSITSLATDEEIHLLWEIIGNILDRNNIDDSGELSIKLI